MEGTKITNIKNNIIEPSFNETVTISFVVSKWGFYA